MEDNKSEYASLKRCVLRRNVKVECVTLLNMSGGREYHRRGAEQLNNSSKPHGSHMAGDWEKMMTNGCVDVQKFSEGKIVTFTQSRFGANQEYLGFF